jgi:hypothetical protein
MIRPATVVVLSILLSVSACASTAEQSQPRTDEIEAWIRQLADADALKRLAACDQLLKCGDAAKPALESTAASGTAAVKPRASRLLKSIATEAYLVKSLSKLQSADTLECDMSVARSHGSFKGHFRGSTDSLRFASDMNVATTLGNVVLRMIGDGTFVWAESQPAGSDHKQIQKYSAATMQKMGTTLHLSPLECVRTVRERFCFTEMRVETKPGAGAEIVFEGQAKDGALERLLQTVEAIGGPSAARSTRVQQQLMDRARISFSKDELQLRSIEILGADEEPLFAMTLSNVKLNAPIDPQTFQFAIPKGQAPIDMDEQLRISKERDGKSE